MNNGLKEYRAIIMVPYQIKVQAHGVASAAEHVKTKLNNIAQDYTFNSPEPDNDPIAPFVHSVGLDYDNATPPIKEVA